MHSKHTPAPLIVDTSTICPTIVDKRRPNRYQIIGCAMQRDEHPSIDDCGLPKEEADANARLWAMAPELYHFVEGVAINAIGQASTALQKQAIEILKHIDQPEEQ